MKVYLVQTCGENYSITWGVCTTVDRAIEVVHSVQAKGLLECEHIEVGEVETDKYLVEGA